MQCRKLHFLLSDPSWFFTLFCIFIKQRKHYSILQVTVTATYATGTHTWDHRVLPATRQM